MQTPRAFFVPALLAVAALAACGSSDDDQPVPPVAVAVGDTVALTVAGSVLSFDRATPATLKGSIAVSGLLPNEKLVGLDVRPADGLLHALSNQARLCTLNAATGAATLFRNTSGDATRSLIGGSAGPSVLDIAIRF